MNLADLPASEVTPQHFPFWNAYNRPYPPALTWRELRAEGFTPKEWTTCGMAEIEESYDELVQWRIDEDGCAKPLTGDERSTWQDRLINSWTRRKEWKL